jgi:hypothetical protein
LLVNFYLILILTQHTGESSWELPANATLEEGGGGTNDQQAYEDAQFADGTAEDGEKYLDVYNNYDTPLGEDGATFEEPDSNVLAQSSVQSIKSSFIPMKLLVRKPSDGSLEKKTSFGNLNMLDKKHSAQNLGIKTGSSFVINRSAVVKDSLKPAGQSSKSNKISGFALLKIGAAILRKQIDENGSTWVEYQAADNGPVFYAEEGSDVAGQWKRPAIFDLEEFSSQSVISVEAVDFNSLDQALISRPSSNASLKTSSVGLSSAVSVQQAGSVPPLRQQPQSTPPVMAVRDKSVSYFYAFICYVCFVL